MMMTTDRIYYSSYPSASGSFIPKTEVQDSCLLEDVGIYVG